MHGTKKNVKTVFLLQIKYMSPQVVSEATQFKFNLNLRN